MGIITPNDPTGSKRPMPSMADLAQEKAVKERAERINTMANEGFELLKNYVVEKEIKLEDMEFFIDAVHKKYQNWAGGVANSLTINQLLDLKGETSDDNGEKSK